MTNRDGSSDYSGRPLVVRFAVSISKFVYLLFMTVLYLIYKVFKLAYSFAIYASIIWIIVHFAPSFWPVIIAATAALISVVTATIFHRMRANSIANRAHPIANDVWDAVVASRES
jgi:hypothetical protein